MGADARGYDRAYFASIRDGSASSASTMVPLLLEYVQPTSVVDVGCGTGEWLAAFARYGITDLLGIDREGVEQAELDNPTIPFARADLEQPIALGRTFDLAVSLEVAEHLPPDRADGFVADLVRLAPVVLFSAAIPSQGGRGHRNEGWPSAWARLFDRHGYDVVDCLRDRVWQCPEVEPWYAQNVLLFVRREWAGGELLLRAALDGAGGQALDRVHPAIYLARADGQLPRRTLVRALARAVSYPLYRYLRRRRIASGPD